MRFFLLLLALLSIGPLLLPAQIIQRDTAVVHPSFLPGFPTETHFNFVREKVDAALDNSSNFNGKVILMIHGSSGSSTPLFDLDYQDYSWMDDLAGAGYDVFCMDLTGYGRSFIPSPMDDFCNLNALDQLGIGATGCTGNSYDSTLTYSTSENLEINAVVDFIRNYRGVNEVTLLGYSLGGARALHYTATYPQKVDRVITVGTGGIPSILQPPPPATLPDQGTPFTYFTASQFTNYFSAPTCFNQLDPVLGSVIWNAYQAIDSLGGTWGSGVARYPNGYYWGLTEDTALAITQPFLMIRGSYDPLPSGLSMDDLYNDLSNVSAKISLTIENADHLVAWEAGRQVLRERVKEWLQLGSVDGFTTGRLTAHVDSSITERGNDPVDPYLLETFPAHLATNVPIASDLEMVFNEFVNSSAQNRELYLYRSDGTLIQTVVLTGNQATEVCPFVYRIDLDTLAPNTTYYVDLEANAYFDGDFNFMPEFSGQAAWTFSTGSVATELTAGLPLGEVRLYPNPVRDELVVEGEEQALEALRMVDVWGRDVGKWVVWGEMEMGRRVLSLEKLPAGVYWLVGNGKGKRVVKM